MRKTLLLFCTWSFFTTAALAQTDLPTVTGNININAGAGYSGQYNTVPRTDGVYDNPTQAPVPGGNVNLRGDVVFTGANPWILHTPNDGRSTLYLAPATVTNPATSSWNWGAATEFSANGKVVFKNDVTIPGSSTVGQRMSIGDVSCASCAGTLLGIKNLTLAVGGRIGARGGIHVVNYGGDWPDYVFAPAYEIRPLAEVEVFIQANHHLPEAPSAAQVQANGLEVVAMEALLLKKIEELTLYLIKLEKASTTLAERVRVLEH